MKYINSPGTIPSKSATKYQDQTIEEFEQLDSQLKSARIDYINKETDMIKQYSDKQFNKQRINSCFIVFENIEDQQACMQAFN